MRSRRWRLAACGLLGSASVPLSNGAPLGRLVLFLRFLVVVVLVVSFVVVVLTLVLASGLPIEGRGGESCRNIGFEGLEGFDDFGDFEG
jgi:hypothetical protein